MDPVGEAEKVSKASSFACLTWDSFEERPSLYSEVEKGNNCVAQNWGKTLNESVMLLCTFGLPEVAYKASSYH